MVARPDDVSLSRPRPRPADAHLPPVTDAGRAAKAHNSRRGRGRGRGAGRSALARIEPTQPGQVVAAAGSAIVTAARVGRLLGRSYLRVARQLPGVTSVEHVATQLRHAAAAELNRLLEMPPAFVGSATPEEQRVMLLVQNSGADAEPLRSAMSELLDRSVRADGEQNRDYLFGTIVSQLVPDEARILAALATGRAFAAIDVVAKQVGRGSTRVVLANASTLGAAAGIALPQNAATYLTRLQGFGLLDFSHGLDHLATQFDALQRDPAVVAARTGVEANKLASVKLVRKTITLSALGQEFWRACAPTPQRR